MVLGVSGVLQEDKVECLKQTEVCVSMRKIQREREREDTVPHPEGAVFYNDSWVIKCV